MAATPSVRVIALDSEAGLSESEQLRAYADRLEQGGQDDHASLEELRRSVGVIYSDFIDAKQIEGRERRTAYARAAAEARAMADKLDNTRRTLVRADHDAGQAIQSITGA